LPVPLVENAPAKVNLSLRVLRRRDDGYHEIESLVAFADFGDRLSFSRGDTLALTARGPAAALIGEADDNLVLRAARALAAHRPSITLGAFHLDKRLPIAAGLGGGSADAGAALRLIAQVNDIARDHSDLYAAARATGADVPVCLDPRARVMRGIGEVLSGPFALPPLPSVLVNPGVALATKEVFSGWKSASNIGSPALDLTALAQATSRDQLFSLLEAQSNDLETPAIALQPVIADVLAGLRGQKGCRLARMSGSGATCFGLFAAAAAAREAAKFLHDKFPQWWVRAVTLS
jgi:4-diphosphocytidyl-2-C-methyl-D-erythritol kinase